MLLDTAMTIGERFKHIRTEKGFSQSELADGICSKTVVSHLENDRQYPSAAMFGKLADKLGVPLREIMGMQEKQLEAGFQIEMVRVYIEKADYDRAIDLIIEMDQREDLLEYQRVELVACHSESLIRAGKYREAGDLLLPFLEQQQSKQSIEDGLLCDLYNKLGTAFFESREFDKAYSAYEQGYRLSKKLPEFDLVSARVAYNLGLTCNHLHHKEDAKRYLKEAYAFYESGSDVNKVADALFALAMATGNVEHLMKARTIYEGLNLERESNLAKVHFAFYVESKRDYAAALQIFDEASDAFRRLGDKGLSVYSFAKSSLVCMDHGDYGRAEGYLKEADVLTAQIMEMEDFYVADFYRAKAIFQLQQENYDQCILDSQTSSKMCDNMGLFEESAVCLQLAAEAYHQKGMDAEAYKISKKAFQLLRPKGEKA